jgi:hypothetical protein
MPPYLIHFDVLDLKLFAGDDLQRETALLADKAYAADWLRRCFADNATHDHTHDFDVEPSLPR